MDTTALAATDSAAPACRDCLDDLLHCHEISLEHADGSTQCLGLAPCEVDHALHAWQLSCSALEPPCPCVPDERAPAVDYDDAAALVAA